VWYTIGMRVTLERRMPSIYGGVTVMHAHKGGDVVLRGERNWWRTASGVLICSRRYRFKLCIMLRHVDKLYDGQ
jgi:hypothetical protein